MRCLAKVSVLLMLIVLLISSCQLLTVQTNVNLDDYTVYSAYLNAIPLAKYHSSTDTVIIRDTTAISPTDISTSTPWSWQVNKGDQLYKDDLVRCEEAHSKAWETLFADVKKQFYQPRLKLQPHFTVSYPTLVASWDQIRQRGNQLVDSQSAIRYIFTLSNIVYDEPKTRALFFSNFWCGGLCGYGELVMLKKVKQRWVLIETFRAWVS